MGKKTNNFFLQGDGWINITMKDKSLVGQQLTPEEIFDDFHQCETEPPDVKDYEIGRAKMTKHGYKLSFRKRDNNQLDNLEIVTT